MTMWVIQFSSRTEANGNCPVFARGPLEAFRRVPCSLGSNSTPHADGNSHPINNQFGACRHNLGSVDDRKTAATQIAHERLLVCETASGTGRNAGATEKALS